MGLINDNLHVNGKLSCVTFDPANGSIAAEKVIHQFPVSHATAAGTDVAAATIPIHIANKDATIVGVQVSAMTAPTGGDKAFTVDVQKGNQAGAFATILSAPVSIAAAQVDREVVAGSLASDVLTDGDTLRVVIAVSGTTGLQGQGMIVTVFLREDP